jgi:hypothetical protein
MLEALEAETAALVRRELYENPGYWSGGHKEAELVAHILKPTLLWVMFIPNQFILT